MYLVPNLAHCGGGPATTVFTANMLTALTDWVENHRAPRAIIAANTSTSSPFPSGPPFDPQVAKNFPTGGTRPLCPYPQQTRYSGSGPSNNAASFRCVVPGGVIVAGGKHVSLLRNALACARQPRLFGETVHRLRRPQCLVHRSRARVHMRIETYRIASRRRHQVIVRIGRHVRRAGNEIIQALAILGKERIHVHDRPNDAHRDEFCCR